MSSEKFPAPDAEARRVTPGVTIEVDSEGNASEIPLVTKEELLGSADQREAGIRKVTNHILQTREQMIKEGK